MCGSASIRASAQQLRPLRVVCHERSWSIQLHVTVREMKEGPSGSAIRSLIPNHRKLLRSKAVVVSVAEKSGQDPGRYGRERRAQANEVRVFGARSRHRNSVGLNAGGAVMRGPMDFSGV